MSDSEKQGYACWVLTSLSIAHDFEIYKQTVSFPDDRPNHIPLESRAQLGGLRHQIVKWTKMTSCLTKVRRSPDKRSSGLRADISNNKQIPSSQGCPKGGGGALYGVNAATRRGPSDHPHSFCSHTSETGLAFVFVRRRWTSPGGFNKFSILKKQSY